MALCSSRSIRLGISTVCIRNRRLVHSAYRHAVHPTALNPRPKWRSRAPHLGTLLEATRREVACMLGLSEVASRIVQSTIRTMSVECEKVGGVNLAQGVCDTEVPGGGAAGGRSRNRGGIQPIHARRRHRSPARGDRQEIAAAERNRGRSGNRNSRHLGSDRRIRFGLPRAVEPGRRSHSVRTVLRLSLRDAGGPILQAGAGVAGSA